MSGARSLRTPNTFIIGAPKSGTTYLADWLGQVGSVFMPVVKEPGYFVSDSQRRRGLDHYLMAHYARAVDERLVVDATPWYLYPASVSEEISSAFGSEELRFIVILREPVSRAISMYHDQVGKLTETRSFEQAIDDEMAMENPERHLAGAYPPVLNRLYALCGLYAPCIERYMDRFGSESVCVLLTTDLEGRQAKVQEQLGRFLGLELPTPPEHRANSAAAVRSRLIQRGLLAAERVNDTWKSRLVRALPAGSHRRVLHRVERWNRTPVEYGLPPGEVLNRLKDWYSASNCALARLIGRDLSAWS